MFVKFSDTVTQKLTKIVSFHLCYIDIFYLTQDIEISVLHWHFPFDTFYLTQDMETAGFQLRYIDVRDRAGELLRLNHGHNSPYRDCSPGHNWLAGFLKRHPGMHNPVKDWFTIHTRKLPLC